MIVDARFQVSEARFLSDTFIFVASLVDKAHDQARDKGETNASCSAPSDTSPETPCGAPRASRVPRLYAVTRLPLTGLTP